ncbi:MAG: type II toxin-antitoxin system VapC family toxin [Thermodesulfobacteriota bacterium]|nr:type II toxin-antitoxin system VapC family toxin [Thermodesulfobacteriota bacterium]
MIIVLDASAAVETVLQRKKGRELLQHLKDAEWVIAPGLFIPEVTNVFWKYVQFGSLSVSQCESGVEMAVALPDEYAEDKILHKEAFSLACNLGTTAYDMFYLALARRNNAHLMSLDKALYDTAARQSVRTI